MKFEPVEHPPSCAPFFHDAVPENRWVPQCSHPCSFDPAVFLDKMTNLVLNPNLNSTWLFRADILSDTDAPEDHQDHRPQDEQPPPPITHDVLGMTRRRTLVRRLVPRNEKRDRPLDQTCAFYRADPDPALALPDDDDDDDDDAQSTLVIYAPHAALPADMPFYHPRVRGIAHLHRWHPSAARGTTSVHFLPFLPLPGRAAPDAAEPAEEAARLRRTAYHLLETITKHGHATDYVKRVRHDVVVPRRRFQDRYALLKARHARRLVDSWAESTDPAKHVFEDLGIAAFLIELWADMYPAAGDGGSGFPGFVDMACGNGLLVHILNLEGFPGWGFDARRRKSWARYAAADLQERLLLPGLLASSSSSSTPPPPLAAIPLHDGAFPRGTFIISNHGDELTPWTPLLASLSRCPFIVIPCCSHNLAGERFRAPPPRDPAKSRSAYASLVDWVARIAEDCGWVVETEMLRIPSTRNTCLLGRARLPATAVLDHAAAVAVVERYGGVGGYYEAVSKLVKSGPRGH